MNRATPPSCAGPAHLMTTSRVSARMTLPPTSLRAPEFASPARSHLPGVTGWGREVQALSASLSPSPSPPF